MYTLQIDAQGAGAINWTGYRYAWADTLIRLGYGSEGTHSIPEPDAWTLAEAFESDTEGDHSPFPCLNPRSTLYANLVQFWDSIV